MEAGLERLASSDWEELLAQQVRENGRLFYRLAYRILRNQSEAEDSCQSAFARAWRVRDSIRDSRALKAWLLSAVTNDALELTRRRRTERRFMERGPARGDGPADPLDRLAARESVTRALGRLPEPTRTVVVLRIVEGMPGNEVAGLIGRSPSEVTRRLYEGLEQLRRGLSDWDAAVEEKTHAV